MIQAYFREIIISNRQSHHILKGTRQTVMKPKVSRMKEIKIRAEISKKEMKKTIAKINNTKTWFVEKINEIDKPLAIVIKKKKEEEGRIKAIKLEMKMEKSQQKT